MPCWTRAIVGDLEAALADCDEANRLKPNYTYALDSRGFTYLKMGKFLQAIADYDAALKIDPRIAHSLYGRGLAKLKSNDAEGGRVDIALAKDINAEIGKIFEPLRRAMIGGTGTCLRGDRAQTRR